MRRHRLALAAAIPVMLAAVALPLLLSAPASAEEARPAVLNPDHVNTINIDFEHGDCPDKPGSGWHFVVPGNGNFVTLSVTFETAGTRNLSGNDFGPPDASHAYVFTPTNDKLLSGSATITGGNKDEFNLSHTCPATTDPGPEPSETTSPEPTETTSPDPTETTSPDPTETTSPDPTETSNPDPTETSNPDPTETTDPEPTETTDPEPTETISPTVSATTVTRSPTVAPTVKGTKHTRAAPQTLPRTGKPTGRLTLLGVLLLAVGIVLVYRTNEPRAARKH